MKKNAETRFENLVPPPRPAKSVLDASRIIEEACTKAMLWGIVIGGVVFGVLVWLVMGGKL